MEELLARDLDGKPVVGIDGTDFGTLDTITMDAESGALCDLVVDARSRSASTATVRPDDDGRSRIPVSRIESVNKQIVVRVAETGTVNSMTMLMTGIRRQRLSPCRARGTNLCRHRQLSDGR